MQNEFQASITEYDEAIVHKPDDADLFLGRGTNYLYLGLNRRAIADFTETIRLNPDCPEAYQYRSIAYASLR